VSDDREQRRQRMHHGQWELEESLLDAQEEVTSLKEQVDYWMGKEQALQARNAALVEAVQRAVRMIEPSDYEGERLEDIRAIEGALADILATAATQAAAQWTEQIRSSEREACAKVADDMGHAWYLECERDATGVTGACATAAADIRDAIRARGTIAPTTTPTTLRTIVMSPEPGKDGEK
jgi:hypothetical protein